MPIKRRPRAFAIMVVLFLLSTLLAVSYAMMSSQTTGVLIQNNTIYRSQARQAAMSGMGVALREISRASWAGVGSSLSGSISATDTYAVTFAVDDTIPWNDPDYLYRVKITSTGTSTNPDNPTRPSTHTIQVIVQLAPEAITPQPADWATMQQYTFYQWDDQDCDIDLPFRIEGPVRFQKKVQIAKNYPSTSFRKPVRALLVKTTGLLLTDNESDIKSFLVGKGYTVTTLSEGASSSTFDTYTNVNDVVYITEDCLSTNLNTKLRGTHIGVVFEEVLLGDEFGLYSSGGTLDELDCQERRKCSMMISLSPRLAVREPPLCKSWEPGDRRTHWERWIPEKHFTTRRPDSISPMDVE